MATAEYKTMTSAEIREDFLTFFESKGCKRYESSSLIPEDPSLLLANAGMNQFKEYYQGTKTMQEIGATSCQKCLRTNDIDNIGDARHLSFFEMLGNFSFGGYTKKDAITWAWEFITSDKHLGLPKDKLYITVFTNDDEAAQIWQDQGVEPDHISRLGEEDNFWAAGPTGLVARAPRFILTRAPNSRAKSPVMMGIATSNFGISSLPNTIVKKTAPCQSFRTAISIRVWALSAWLRLCSTKAQTTKATYLIASFTWAKNSAAKPITRAVQWIPACAFLPTTRVPAPL